MFGKFEVSKSYKLPVLEKPHSNVFSIILFLKTFKRSCVFSPARPHDIKRYNSAILILVIEHKNSNKVRLTVE